MLRVLNNDQLKAMEGPKQENKELVSNIASYIQKKWSVARDHKANKVTSRLLKCQRQRLGEYDPDKLTQIRKQGGSEIYMQITAVKCRAAEAWIRDVMTGMDRPWTLEPTPLPDLPPMIQQAVQQKVAMELQQQAQLAAAPIPNVQELIEEKIKNLQGDIKKKAYEEAKSIIEQMEDKCHDQMIEGDWDEAFSQVISDISTFPSAIIKGPILRKKKCLYWKPTGSQWEAATEESIKPEFERISPFDLFPSPDSTSIENGYLFERHALHRSDLSALIGVPSYKEAAIREVLKEFATGGLANWLQGDSERAALESKDVAKSELIEALEYWGPVTGELLKEWGVDGVDPELDYQVNAWLIGKHVIRALLNPDPLGKKPYSMSSYERVAGSFWGRGIPELMEDVQSVCNATARALVNNMGIASGPQVEVNIDRIPQGEDFTDIYPWKIWQVSNDMSGSASPAVRFNQPTAIIDPLLVVYEKFARLADDYTGIPAYTYGNSSVGGAGRTASGLSMLMSSASKGIKQVVSNVDTGIVAPTVERLYNHNMRYDEDLSIKGDAKVVARGSLSLMQKEQLMVRRNEFLQATANPIDSQILGVKGRGAILREVAKELDMPIDDIIPDELDQLQQQLMQQMQQQQPATETDPAGNPASGADTALF
jgi:hypothetical protein